MEPAFSDKELGSTITGYLLAKLLASGGSWLVYQPKQDEYDCLWGTLNTAQVGTELPEIQLIVGGIKCLFSSR